MWWLRNEVSFSILQFMHDQHAWADDEQGELFQNNQTIG